MNHSETARALALVQAFDQRTIGDADVIAWQSVLPDAAYADVEEAIRQHYAEQTDRIMPAHVRRVVRDIVRARQVSPWAPGQHGVPRAEAMPEVAGPVDENAITPQVRDLLQSVRAMLPEGSREALMPRTVAWEREHRAFVRTQDAEPNPLYKPSACKGASGGCLPQAVCPARVHWWEQVCLGEHECLIKDGRCIVKGHEHYLTEQERAEVWADDEVHP